MSEEQKIIANVAAIIYSQDTRRGIDSSVSLAIDIVNATKRLTK